MLINTSRTQHISTLLNTVSTSTTLPNTTVVITSCQTSHWISIGANPTINTATSFIMPANTVLEFNCAVGDKVAVAAHATTGHIGIAY